LLGWMAFRLATRSVICGHRRENRRTGFWNRI